MLAVPGEITSTLSAGTNALLRLGATPVTKVEDVLEAFGVEAVPPRSASLSPAATAVLARLGDGPLTGDELVRAAGISPPEASAALLELELGGSVTLEDGVYRPAI